MKSLTRGHLKAGIDSVRGAKMRNFWTMLGVIIGVASVISVVGIGEGIKNQIASQIHSLGSNLITVRPSELVSGNSGLSSNLNLLSGLNISSTLTAQDAQVVAHAKGVTSSAPLSIVTGAINAPEGRYKKGFVIGTSQDLPSLLNQSLAYGSFLSDYGSTNEAVLGANAATAMFNEEVPLGQDFSFHGQQFVVEGIFNQFNNTPLSQSTDFNNAVFISNTIAETLTNNTAPVYEILARPSNSKDTAKTASYVTAALNQAHGGQSDLTVLQGNQNIAASDDILNLLTGLISGVAAISLLVGGIGIMDVMLVSVAERNHEIGIRKAVGATNRQILSQFMIESAMLSLSGGLLGILLSGLINVGLRLSTSLKPTISWQVVVLATGVSLLIGIIFGSIPALKAARKHPIEALRSE